MKKTNFRLSILSILALTTLTANAQGWPENYDGVMLQGFSWDSFDATQWTTLEAQADELSQYFKLIWVPQSGNCDGTSMGYNPLYYFDQNSTFGTEAELRSMIRTFSERGIGTIADVVINHRKNLSNWVDFPAETYKGETYEMVSTDICRDDDGGETKKWADKNGFELSANTDAPYEDWNGMRDLDHASPNVQRCVMAYEDFLLNDLGYVGFRYDVAKGFAPKYFGIYNAKAGVEFSVGEYWDGNAKAVRSWITNTTQGGSIQSAAFDFPFRYRVRDAFKTGKFSNLNEDCLIKTENYRRYAVTFVENHDTQDRRPVGGSIQDPVVSNDDFIPACNAAMLVLPGTPCVFQLHWLKKKAEIKQLILARRAASITNTTDFTVLEASDHRFMTECGDLLAVIGSDNQAKARELGFTRIISGKQYAYYLRNTLEMPWLSLASCEMLASDGASVSVSLTAVSADASARLVFTTDGTEPTAENGTVADSGVELVFGETTTLKVGLLTGGKVKNVQTRTYAFVTPPPFEPYEASVYVKADFTPVFLYIWDSNNNSELNGKWPGARLDNESSAVTIDGETWYRQTFAFAEAGYYFNLVVSQGNGKPQSEDVTRIKSDLFLLAKLDPSSRKGISLTDVTADHVSGIELPAVEEKTVRGGIFSIDGRRLDVRGSFDEVLERLPRGLYLIDGRKVVKP